jgi:hypothetical protein
MKNIIIYSTGLVIGAVITIIIIFAQYKFPKESPKKADRYFFVSYTINNENVTKKGDYCLQIDSFPKYKILKLYAYLASGIKCEKDKINLDDVCISGIYEFKDSTEYNEFEFKIDKTFYLGVKLIYNVGYNLKKSSTMDEYTKENIVVGFPIEDRQWGDKEENYSVGYYPLEQVEQGSYNIGGGSIEEIEGKLKKYKKDLYIKSLKK